MSTLTDQSRKYDNTAHMKRMYTPYSVIVAHVTRDMIQRRWGEKDLGSHDRRVEEFKRMFVETFDWNFNSGLYAIEYHLLHHKWKIHERSERYRFWSAVHTCIFMCALIRRLK